MALPQPKQPAAFRKYVLALLGENYGDKTLVLCPTAFVTLLGGDHKAAILLAQILYWADRTKNADGWFYKSYAEWQKETGLSEAQVRRIVNGDPRVQSAQVTLRDIGVETVIKKVKHTGAPTLHYRINQTQFLAALERLLGQGDSQHCEESMPNKVGDELSTMSAINPEQCQPSLISTETTNPKISAEEYDHQNPTHHPDEDLDIFFPFENRFGLLKQSIKDVLRNELTRLGATKIREVLDRCATRGRSWVYVQRALANEAAAPELQEPSAETRYGGFLAFNNDECLIPQSMPAEALVTVSERVQTLWDGGADPHATIDDAWHAVLHQLESQLDRATFNICLRDAILVDFEPQLQIFVVVVRTGYARDFLQGRLDRMVKRILGDVYEQSSATQFLTADEWRLQEGKVGQNAAIA